MGVSLSSPTHLSFRSLSIINSFSVCDLYDEDEEINQEKSIEYLHQSEGYNA